MKTLILATSLCLLGFFVTVEKLSAQINREELQNLDSTSIVTVKLVGGSVYEGNFVRQTNEKLVLQIKGTGMMSFQFSDIKNLDIKGHGQLQRKELVFPLIDTGKTVKMSLKDGSVLVGKLVSQTETEVVINGPTTGKTTIPASQIKSVEQDGGKQLQGSFGRRLNPNPTRYFFAPSAFNLKKGEGYYQNVAIDINMLSYGVTDWFSMGGGIELIYSLVSLTSGGFTPLWMITPKVGFPVGKNWHLGAGFMGGIYRMQDNLNELPKRVLTGFGITYGLATYGNPDNNITLGVGFPVRTNADNFISPIFVINGMCRLNQKISLISENWIMTGSGLNLSFNAIFGYGIRLNADNVSFDFGFINNKGIAQLIIVGIPYIDFVYKFGER